MGKLDNNESFTQHFKSTVDRVEQSEELELARKKIEYGSSEPIDMSEQFEDDILTVVKVIKKCEKDATSVDWPVMIGSFFSSSVALYMAGAAISSGQVTASIITGGFGLSILILSIMNFLKERKIAAQNVIELREATGLNDEMIIVILKELAQEGNELAQTYYEKIMKAQKAAKGRKM